MVSLVPVMVAAKVVVEVVQAHAAVNIPTATAATMVTVVPAQAISRQARSSMKAVHNSATKAALGPVHQRPQSVQPMCVQ